MTERQKDITSFLKYAYEFKNACPEDISEDYIYTELKNYDVHNKDVNTPYNPGYFTYLTEFYKNNKVLDVFNDSSQSDFLQVQHFKSNQRADLNFLKLYVNVTKEGYFDCARDLLDFLSKHPEIEHMSKISKTCRSDQIVMRVRDMDGIYKIIDFIAHNNYFKNSLRNSNPFLMKYGAVGLAFDNLLSYNGLMSHYIFEYINTKSSVDEISSDDFVKYISNVYNELINSDVNDTYINYLSSYVFSDDLQYLKSLGLKTSVSDVMFIHTSILNQFVKLYNSESLIDLNNLFEKSKDNEYKNSIIQSLDDKYKNYKEISSTLYYKKIIDDFIIYASIKYHSATDPAIRLDNFSKLRIKDPDKAINFITKDNGFRDKFRNISPDIIYKITNSNIYGYVDDLINQVNLNDYEGSLRSS